MTEQPALSVFETGKPYMEDVFLPHARSNSTPEPFLRTRGDLLKRLSSLRLQPAELLTYILKVSIQREDEWCFLLFPEGHEVVVPDKNVTFISMAISGNVNVGDGNDPLGILRRNQCVPSSVRGIFSKFTPQLFPRLDLAATDALKDFIPSKSKALRTFPNKLTGMYFPVLLRQQMIGGLIWVRPDFMPYASIDLDHGEEFSKVIAFPLETARLAHPPLTEVISQESEFLKNVQVLVVDDDEDVRIFVALLLEECGAKVFQAENVASAYDILRTEEIHGIVSDIAMPDEDGYVLIKKVKALEIEFGKRIPALALTAFARAEDSTQLLQAGFQMHLSKPIDPSELVGIVAWLVGRGE